MSNDPVMLKLRGVPAAHLLAVEHAELIVALYAAAAALDTSMECTGPPAPREQC